MRGRAAAAHLLLACVVTWPVALHPRSVLIGHPDADVWNHAWGPWWWASSLAGGHLPWTTTLLHAPNGGSLWFIDPALACVGAPLVGLIGVAATWNLLIFASVVATSVGAGRFARELGAAGSGPWVASAAAASSSAVLCALHNGVSEALHLAPAAFGFAAVEAAARGRGRWAVAGALVGLSALISPYLGLGTVLVAAPRVISARRRAVWGMLPALLVVALPPLVLLVAQLHDTDGLIRRPPEMNFSLALHNAVDPRTFVVPGFASVDLRAEGFVQLGYLGLATLVLAGLCARWKPAHPWLAGAALGGIFALGPWLFVGQDWVRVAGLRVALPWWLVQGGAVGIALTHPLRMAAPAALALAGLAGWGSSRVGRWGVLLPVIVLADGLGSGPWPVATAPAAIPSIYKDLPVTADGILDLPTDVGPTMRTSRYLYWQTAHGHPIPYIPDARASTASLRFDLFFQVLAGRCSRRDDEEQRMRFANVPLRLANPRTLRKQGFRWVILHAELDPDATARLLPVLESFLGDGEVVGGDQRWDLAAIRR